MVCPLVAQASCSATTGRSRKKSRKKSEHLTHHAIAAHPINFASVVAWPLLIAGINARSSRTLKKKAAEAVKGRVFETHHELCKHFACGRLGEIR
jgi:hypothetical protein